jgi:anti-sigma factor RsiW
MTDALHEEALLLSPYLDHVLEPAEAARLDAHLAGCDACRRQLEGLRRTVGLVKALPRERMPHPVSIPVQRPQGWAWRNALMPLAGAVAALLLVVGAYQLGRNGAPGPATAESLALLSKGGRPAAPVRDSAQGAALAPSSADAARMYSRTAADGRVTLNIATDRSAYARTDTVVITTRTTGAPNRATLQLDREGYRVPISSGSTAGSEVRSRLALSSVSPPVTPGDYRIVATLALEGDAQLVAEVTITVS